jgi:hypothetical protein
MTRLPFLLTLAVVSCSTHKQNSNNVSSSIDTVIVVSNHIKLSGYHSSDFGGTSFKPIIVSFDKKIVFQDSLNDYWLTGYSTKHYPKFLKCTNGDYQLLIEVDERPNKNELTSFTVTKNGQLYQARLPLFNWNPEDIDNDGKFELKGILTNGETIANGDTAFYNPTLVYELEDNRLTLDSSATLEINRRIWGKFYDYNYNDTLLLPFNRNE